MSVRILESAKLGSQTSSPASFISSAGSDGYPLTLRSALHKAKPRRRGAPLSTSAWKLITAVLNVSNFLKLLRHLRLTPSLLPRGVGQRRGTSFRASALGRERRFPCLLECSCYRVASDKGEGRALEVEGTGLRGRG